MRGRYGERLLRLKEIVVALQTGYMVGKNVYDAFELRRTDQSYVIEVAENDPLFGEVQTWLLTQVTADKRHRLSAYVKRGVESRSDEPRTHSSHENARRVWSLNLANVSGDTYLVHVAGHLVRVRYIEPNIQTGLNVDGSPNTAIMSLMRIKIEFRCKTVESRDAVIDLLRDLTRTYQERDRGLPRVFRSTKYGGWTEIDSPPRPIETVVLARDDREFLIEDLSSFLDGESAYVDLGIPWHRGYMLHGPPGTGKTSIARALASHVGLDLFYISLGDLEHDADLAHMLSQLGPRSMLLLEDVDVAHAAKERSDKDRGVSLSMLLNALDGVVTPHGLVTVMTTNNLDAIDDALLRTGRVDVSRKIDYLDDDQLDRLVGVMIAEDHVQIPTVEDIELAPSDVIDVIKEDMTSDPEFIIKRIIQLIEERK